MTMPNTTTCYSCGNDHRDRDMMPNATGDGELCPACYLDQQEHTPTQTTEVMTMERSCDVWADMLESARKLDDSELSGHANVSTRNNHACVECFTCACAAVRDERRGTDIRISIARRAKIAAR